jgi:diguanylate cyclase (GGDEF)-like protein
MSQFLEQISHSKILIVGELPQSLTFLVKLLSEEGYTVSTLLNRDELVSLQESQPFDLILLSTTLASPDGYEICQKIKSNPKFVHIPVIFLRLDGSQISPLKIFQAGGFDYINYPSFTIEILSRIESQLILGRLKKTVEKQNSYLQRAMQELEKLQNFNNQEYERLKEENKKLTFLDPLTQIANRRHFEECLHKEWRRSSRDRISWGDSVQTSLSLVLCRLDYFPHSESESNSCLLKITESLQKIIKRSADLLARFSRDEFIILLPNTSQEGALKVADSINQEVRNLQISTSTPASSPYLTLSIGIATGIPAQALSPDLLLEAVQKAVDIARQGGGNRIIES